MVSFIIIITYISWCTFFQNYQVSDSANGHCQPTDCQFCLVSLFSCSSYFFLYVNELINHDLLNLQGSYPRMKFKVSTNDIFKKSAIIVEINESTTRLQRRWLRGGLPADYWHFIPRDPQIDESCMKPNKRVLSHAQVDCLLLCAFVTILVVCLLPSFTCFLS